MEHRYSNKCLHKIFLAALFTTAKIQLTFPATDEWILWCVYKMEYCASMKTIEVLIHGTKRKKLENIMLNERNQTEKTMYFMIPFI